jgi:hypothetical protein
MKDTNQLALLVLGLLAVVLSLGCRKNDTVSPSSSVITGKYNYSGYGLDSTLFASGIINIVLTDSIISGTRNLQVVDTMNSQAGEAGIGDIAGTMSTDHSFYIYLVTNRLPAVLIRGTFSAGLITGPRVIDTGARPEPTLSGYYTLQKD